MRENILDTIRSLEKVGLSNINMLALVSATSYEVIFYGDYQGRTYQSNEIFESGIIAPNIVNDFYKQIAEIIRGSDDYLAEKMNIVKSVEDRYIDFSYDEIDCRVYKIKKEWKNSL